MKKLVLGSALVMLFGVASSAMAKGPTWNYVSASWVVDGTADLGGNDVDLKGFSFDVSKTLNDVVFFSASSNQYYADTGSINFDTGVAQVGIGGRFPVGGNTDLWAALNYNRMTIEGAAGLGLGASVGVRSAVGSNVEVGALYKSVGSVDFGASVDGKFSGYELSGAYNFSPTTAALLTISNTTLEIESLELESDVVGLGVRLSF